MSVMSAVYDRFKLDTLLVSGFIREITDQEIPNDIIHLCVSWCHIKCHFSNIGYDNTSIQFTQDATVVTKNGYGPKSIYGSVVMPSKCEINIEYKYKIKILVDASSQPGISIGIDEAKQHNIHKDFAGCSMTKNYGYYSVFGTIYDHNTDGSLKGNAYGDGYGEGDIISLCYNPHDATLSFAKNDVNQGPITNIESRDDLKYRLCIFMGYGRHSKVQLTTTKEASKSSTKKNELNPELAKYVKMRKLKMPMQNILNKNE